MNSSLVEGLDFVVDLGLEMFLNVFRFGYWGCVGSWEIRVLILVLFYMLGGFAGVSFVFWVIVFSRLF